jgi:hypothetical protein
MDPTAKASERADSGLALDLRLASIGRSADYAPKSIVGFAIVSKDGMLANAAGVIPASLKCEADRLFFEHGMDKVDVAVHGRHSNERQPKSFSRKRLILTRQIRDIEPADASGRVFHWNPGGASFEEALAAVDAPGARVGVVGATDVFGLFLGGFDSFFLTRGPDVVLQGGRPVFPGVPEETPEQVLAGAGLISGDEVELDQDRQLVVAHWCRPDR